MFQSFDYFHKIQSLIEIEEVFIEDIKKMDHRKLQNFHENLRKVMTDYRNFYDLVFRQLKVTEAFFKMSKLMALNDILELIVEETCQCL